MSNKAKMPPVPPAGVSSAGTGSATPGESALPANQAQENIESKNRKLEQQGRQGNTWQNTHHQGHQQDR
jgi:hypothetical protein